MVVYWSFLFFLSRPNSQLIEVGNCSQRNRPFLDEVFRLGQEKKKICTIFLSRRIHNERFGDDERFCSLSLYNMLMYGLKNGLKTSKYTVFGTEKAGRHTGVQQQLRAVFDGGFGCIWSVRTLRFGALNGAFSRFLYSFIFSY